jgi:hypothetical protein
MHDVATQNHKFSRASVLPLLAGKQIAAVRKRRRPSATDKPRVPPDMIGMQMRDTTHSRCPRVQNRRRRDCRDRASFSMIAQLMRALLAIAGAGVDEYSRERCLYDRAVFK